MNRRKFLAAMGSLALPAPALAQGAAAFPSRPITLIVPFSAGGTADIFGRMIAEHLHKTWGQPVVVENVGGAGSIVGITRIARGAPDGTMIGLASTSGLSINPSLYGAKLSYKPAEDLVPIAQVSMVPNVLVVNPDKIKARTVPDLIAHLKANPDKVSFGSAGVGTSQHLAAELFMQLTGTKMTHVPYRGSSQMVQDLITGNVELAFDNVPLLLPQAASGKLAMIATATTARAPFDPNLPAIAEFLPGFEAVAWHGLVAPSALPKEIVEKIAAEVTGYMKRPETQQKFAELGAVAMATGPAEFAAYARSETERWKKVIETANIRIE